MFALVASPLATAAAQSRDSTGVAPKPAVVAGVIKDEYGEPLAGVEVRAEPGDHGARTDTLGRFHLRADPGEYNVVFRRLGYAPQDYSWRARGGEGTTLSIRLDPLPQRLDTVVVRDSHDRVAGNSTISGVVVDTTFQPLSDVELQLMGTGRHARSYESGQFFFAGLAQGDYVVRARRLGYVPGNFTVRVGSNETHQFRVILDILPHTLSTVQITEQSGYGRSASAWADFDRRQRWKSNLTATITREDLDRFGKTPLDWALQSTRASSLVHLPTWFGGGPPATSISTHSRSRGIPPVPDDVCVLINGINGARLPLRWFSANEVERVEVFPANTDWTATISSRMSAVPGCGSDDDIHHPPYFVIWMRGAS